MRCSNSGFIIDTKGCVRLWIVKRRCTPTGFTFYVTNGDWEGTWWDSDDLLTNGGFTMRCQSASKATPSTFLYTPPDMPKFGNAQYNAAIEWMQNNLDREPEAKL